MEIQPAGTNPMAVPPDTQAADRQSDAESTDQNDQVDQSGDSGAAASDGSTGQNVDIQA